MLTRSTRAGLPTLALAACNGKAPADTTGGSSSDTTDDPTGTPTGSAGSSTTGDMLGFAADIWDPIFAPACTCHRIDGRR